MSSMISHLILLFIQVSVGAALVVALIPLWDWLYPQEDRLWDKLPWIKIAVVITLAYVGFNYSSVAPKLELQNTSHYNYQPDTGIRIEPQEGLTTTKNRWESLDDARKEMEEHQASGTTTEF